MISWLVFRSWVTTLTQKGTGRWSHAAPWSCLGQSLIRPLRAFHRLRHVAKPPSITDSQRSFHLRLLPLTVKLMEIMMSAKGSVFSSQTVCGFTDYRVACCRCKYSRWCTDFIVTNERQNCRSQWPRGLRRGSAAARLLRSWVQIPPGAWIFVCCECCVLSGRGLCDELITRPEESYRLWCVIVCDLEKLHGWGGHGPHWAAAPH